MRALQPFDANFVEPDDDPVESLKKSKKAYEDFVEAVEILVTAHVRSGYRHAYDFVVELAQATRRVDNALCAIQRDISRVNAQERRKANSE